MVGTTGPEDDEQSMEDMPSKDDEQSMEEESVGEPYEGIQSRDHVSSLSELMEEILEAQKNMMDEEPPKPSLSKMMKRHIHTVCEALEQRAAESPLTPAHQIELRDDSMHVFTDKRLRYMDDIPWIYAELSKVVGTYATIMEERFRDEWVHEHLLSRKDAPAGATNHEHDAAPLGIIYDVDIRGLRLLCDAIIGLVFDDLDKAQLLNVCKEQSKEWTFAKQDKNITTEETVERQKHRMAKFICDYGLGVAFTSVEQTLEFFELKASTSVEQKRDEGEANIAFLCEAMGSAPEQFKAIQVWVLESDREIVQSEEKEDVDKMGFWCKGLQMDPMKFEGLWYDRHKTFLAESFERRTLQQSELLDFVDFGAHPDARLLEDLHGKFVHQGMYSEAAEIVHVLHLLARKAMPNSEERQSIRNLCTKLKDRSPEMAMPFYASFQQAKKKLKKVLQAFGPVSSEGMRLPVCCHFVDSKEKLNNLPVVRHKLISVDCTISAKFIICGTQFYRKEPSLVCFATDEFVIVLDWLKEELRPQFGEFFLQVLQAAELVVCQDMKGELYPMLATMFTKFNILRFVDLFLWQRNKKEEPNVNELMHLIFPSMRIICDAERRRNFDKRPLRPTQIHFCALKTWCLLPAARALFRQQELVNPCDIYGPVEREGFASDETNDQDLSVKLLRKPWRHLGNGFIREFMRWPSQVYPDHVLLELGGGVSLKVEPAHGDCAPSDEEATTDSTAHAILRLCGGNLISPEERWHDTRIDAVDVEYGRYFSRRGPVETTPKDILYKFLQTNKTVEEDPPKTKEVERIEPDFHLNSIRAKLIVHCHGEHTIVGPWVSMNDMSDKGNAKVHIMLAYEKAINYFHVDVSRYIKKDCHEAGIDAKPGSFTRPCRNPKRNYTRSEMLWMCEKMHCSFVGPDGADGLPRPDECTKVDMVFDEDKALSRLQGEWYLMDVLPSRGNDRAKDEVVKFAVTGRSVQRVNSSSSAKVYFERQFCRVLGCTPTHITWGETIKSGRWDGRIHVQRRAHPESDGVSNRTVVNVNHEVIEWKGNPYIHVRLEKEVFERCVRGEHSAMDSVGCLVEDLEVVAQNHRSFMKKGCALMRDPEWDRHPMFPVRKSLAEYFSTTERVDGVDVRFYRSEIKDWQWIRAIDDSQEYVTASPTLILDISQLGFDEYCTKRLSERLPRSETLDIHRLREVEENLGAISKEDSHRLRLVVELLAAFVQGGCVPTEHHQLLFYLDYCLPEGYRAENWTRDETSIRELLAVDGVFLAETLRFSLEHATALVKYGRETFPSERDAARATACSRVPLDNDALRKCKCRGESRRNAPVEVIGEEEEEDKDWSSDADDAVGVDTARKVAEERPIAEIVDGWGEWASAEEEKVVPNEGGDPAENGMAEPSTEMSAPPCIFYDVTLRNEWNVPEKIRAPLAFTLPDVGTFITGVLLCGDDIVAAEVGLDDEDDGNGNSVWTTQTFRSFCGAAPDIVQRLDTEFFDRMSIVELRNGLMRLEECAGEVKYVNFIAGCVADGPQRMLFTLGGHQHVEEQEVTLSSDFVKVGDCAVGRDVDTSGQTDVLRDKPVVYWTLCRDSKEITQVVARVELLPDNTVTVRGMLVAVNKKHQVRIHSTKNPPGKSKKCCWRMLKKISERTKVEHMVVRLHHILTAVCTHVIELYKHVAEAKNYTRPMCRKVGQLVVLTGAVTGLPTAKQPFAVLPDAMWPLIEMTFFCLAEDPLTRNESLETVVVDAAGKLWCGNIESMATKILHLGGILFAARSLGALADEDKARKAVSNEEHQEKLRERVEELERQRDEEEEYWKAIPDKWKKVYRLPKSDGKQAYEYIGFMLDHDTTESVRLTHSSFLGRCEFSKTGMWVFDTPEDKSKLYQVVQWFYARKIPVILMERQTPGRFVFIEDIDIRGGDLEPLPGVMEQRPQEKLSFRLCLSQNWRIFDPEMPETFNFMLYRSAVLHEFFPQLDELRVNIYSASGWNSTKCYMKISFHLVWPDLILDEPKSKMIRDRTMERFEEWAAEPNHPVAKFKADVIDIDHTNTWDDVFDDTTTHGTNGLRMPYCDKASEVLKKEFQEKKDAGEYAGATKGFFKKNRMMMKKPEGRPNIALCQARLVWDESTMNDPENIDGLPRLEIAKREEDYSIAEWMEEGTCRVNLIDGKRAPMTPISYPAKYKWLQFDRRVPHKRVIDNVDELMEHYLSGECKEVKADVRKNKREWHLEEGWHFIGPLEGGGSNEYMFEGPVVQFKPNALLRKYTTLEDATVALKGKGYWIQMTNSVWEFTVTEIGSSLIFFEDSKIIHLRLGQAGQGIDQRAGAAYCYLRRLLCSWTTSVVERDVAIYDDAKVRFMRALRKKEERKATDKKPFYVQGVIIVPQHFPTIQMALDNCPVDEEMQRIIIRRHFAKNSFEPVNIDKSILLEGEAVPLKEKKSSLESVNCPVITIRGGSPVIRNLQIFQQGTQSCHSQQGQWQQGAVLIKGGSPTFQCCDFESKVEDSNLQVIGICLYAEETASDVLISSCTFTNSHTGIVNWSQEMRIEGNTFSDLQGTAMEVIGEGGLLVPEVAGSKNQFRDNYTHLLLHNTRMSFKNNEFIGSTTCGIRFSNVTGQFEDNTLDCEAYKRGPSKFSFKNNKAKLKIATTTEQNSGAATEEEAYRTSSFVNPRFLGLKESDYIFDVPRGHHLYAQKVDKDLFDGNNRYAACGFTLMKDGEYRWKLKCGDKQYGVIMLRDFVMEQLEKCEGDPREVLYMKLRKAREMNAAEQVKRLLKDTIRWDRAEEVAQSYLYMRHVAKCNRTGRRALAPLAPQGAADFVHSDAHHCRALPGPGDSIAVRVDETLLHGEWKSMGVAVAPETVPAALRGPLPYETRLGIKEVDTSNTAFYEFRDETLAFARGKYQGADGSQATIYGTSFRIKGNKPIEIDVTEPGLLKFATDNFDKEYGRLYPSFGSSAPTRLQLHTTYTMTHQDWAPVNGQWTCAGRFLGTFHGHREDLYFVWHRRPRMWADADAHEAFQLGRGTWWRTPKDFAFFTHQYLYRGTQCSWSKKIKWYVKVPWHFRDGFLRVGRTRVGVACDVRIRWRRWYENEGNTAMLHDQWYDAPVETQEVWHRMDWVDTRKDESKKIAYRFPSGIHGSCVGGDLVWDDGSVWSKHPLLWYENDVSRTCAPPLSTHLAVVGVALISWVSTDGFRVPLETQCALFDERPVDGIAWVHVELLDGFTRSGVFGWAPKSIFRLSTDKPDSGAGKKSHFVMKQPPKSFFKDPHVLDRRERPAYEIEQVDIYLESVKKKFPVVRNRHRIMTELNKNRVVCIDAATGSGKSTCVPLFIYAASEGNCRCMVTQPRRKAAQGVAQSVSQFVKREVGEMVGYRVGGKSGKKDNDCPIVFCTVGHVLETLLSNVNEVQRYTHIVLDEAHERSPEMEFLSLLVLILLSLPEMHHVKLILMSATLKEELKDYFNVLTPTGQVETVRIEGSTIHPIEDFYLGECARTFEWAIPPLDPKSTSVVPKGNPTKTMFINFAPLAAKIVAHNLHTFKDEGGGKSILVFLPGLGEMRIVERMITEVMCDGKLYGELADFKWLKVFKYHSSFKNENDDEADKPSRGEVFLFLGTTICESSITFPNLYTIVDFGLHKVPVFDARDVQSLQLKWCSKASMKQRKGRTGRTNSGTVYHLIPKERYDRLPEHDENEAKNINILNLVLQSSYCLQAFNGRPVPFAGGKCQFDREHESSKSRTSYALRIYGKVERYDFEDEKWIVHWEHNDTMGETGVFEDFPERVPKDELVGAPFDKLDDFLSLLPEKPDPTTIETAVEKLRSMRCLENDIPTVLGVTCLKLPLSVKRGRLIFFGAALGIVADACVLAAALEFENECDLFRYKREGLHFQDWQITELINDHWVRAEFDDNSHSEPIAMRNLMKAYLSGEKYTHWSDEQWKTFKKRVKWNLGAWKDLNMKVFEILSCARDIYSEHPAIKAQLDGLESLIQDHVENVSNWTGSSIAPIDQVFVADTDKMAALLCFTQSAHQPVAIGRRENPNITSGIKWVDEEPTNDPAWIEYLGLLKREMPSDLKDSFLDDIICRSHFGEDELAIKMGGHVMTKAVPSPLGALTWTSEEHKIPQPVKVSWKSQVYSGANMDKDVYILTGGSFRGTKGDPKVAGQERKAQAIEFQACSAIYVDPGVAFALLGERSKRDKATFKMKNGYLAHLNGAIAHNLALPEKCVPWNLPVMYEFHKSAEKLCPMVHDLGGPWVNKCNRDKRYYVEVITPEEFKMWSVTGDDVDTEMRYNDEGKLQIVGRYHLRWKVEWSGVQGRADGLKIVWFNSQDLIRPANYQATRPLRQIRNHWLREFEDAFRHVMAMSQGDSEKNFDRFDF
eukprot:GEMP01000036.1.p1 GENE.GEMP01000036.1~~GEMP01000036.1.p1  ORF type:complete len:4360 (+),score=1135.41 GEMP01000036.1:291-13370(+)